MSPINIMDVMPACKIVSCGDENILFGSPPEVVKAISSQKLPIPTSVLIPDSLLIGYNLQNCTEFPLYHFLFFTGALKNKSKLKFLGHKKNIENNQELLRLTLMGPRSDELKKIGLDEKLIEMITNECHYFLLKDSNKKPLEILDLIENYFFDNNKTIKLNDIFIKNIGKNNYEIQYQDEVQQIYLDDNLEQPPPYPVQIDCTPNELCKFGIEILGGASGFSPSNASSGLVIIYNGNYILLDSIPYLDYHLIARGISKNQITSIFLTHIHDDHCNLVPLMLNTNKVKVITTKEIYWMAIYKLSLMLDMPINEILKYFDFIPITVGKTLDYYGLKIKPHYSVHSIPTIGAKFYTNHKKHQYSIAISGDNQSIEDMKKMLAENVISNERYDKMINLYQDDVDIFFADGGEGIIHGNPKDVLQSKAGRVIFFHLDKLPAEFNATFSIASAGKRYVVIQGDHNYYISRSIEFLIHHFFGLQLTWISMIIGNIEITRYNTDDVIIKQGDKSKHKIYLIITGYCSIIIHDGTHSREIAKKESGDLFGEMAVTTGSGLRNASVIAKSPVTLCEITEEIFYALIIKERFKEKLINTWDIRNILEGLRFYKNFPHQALERLARYSQIKTFDINSNLFEDDQKLFYILYEGEIEVKIDDKIIQLTPGDHFDNFLFPLRKSSFYVKKTSKCLYFTQENIEKILSITPLLLYTLKINRKTNIIL